MKSPVCLIGYGYWGKILEKNLVSLGYQPVIHDPALGFDNSKALDSSSHWIIATPAEEHYKQIKTKPNSRKNIFVEKPLCLTVSEVKDLLSLDPRHRIFVDWTYWYNEEVKFIKKLINSNRLGSILAVHAKRLNNGPSRSDVGAKWDLMVHDVSILGYLFGLDACELRKLEFFDNEVSSQYDSCFGVLKYPSFSTYLHVSWNYPFKDRTWQFYFEKGVIEWCDINRTVKLDGKQVLCGVNSPTPVHNALKAFFAEEIQNDALTIKITQLIEE